MILRYRTQVLARIKNTKFWKAVQPQNSTIGITPMTTSTDKAKKPKRKGPIRFEAVVPALVLTLLVGGYFKFSLTVICVG